MRERERRAWPRPLIWYNVRSIVCARLSLSLFGAPPQKISKHAPQKNQKAFEYGTEAGSGSHLANQEASGAGKAFAYGTGAGGRSHLAKLRDCARHCAELYAALRDGARHCNSALSLSFLLRIFSRLSLSLSLSLFGAPPQKISKHAPKKNQKACAYGTEAGSGSHLANQEASGAGKAFAYGTGAGGRSHLAKLRNGARHCAELCGATRWCAAL